MCRCANRLARFEAKPRTENEAGATGQDEDGVAETPEWSDLELARRIAHILMRADENQDLNQGANQEWHPTT